MPRPLLPSHQVTPAALAKMNAFHAETLQRVLTLLRQHDVVVVGMAWNPSCGKALAALREAKLPHHYEEIGSYAGRWRERLAIKLWSGWPTYPQVFVRGNLVGGNTDLRAALADGTINRLLSATRISDDD